MNTIRKALLPTGIAFAFLLFLGAFGSTQTTNAFLVDVYGPSYLNADSSSPYASAGAYWVHLSNDWDDDDIVADINGGGRIIAYLDGDDFEDIVSLTPWNGTNFIADLDVIEFDDLSPGLLNELVRYGFNGEDLNIGPPDGLALVIVECTSLGGFTVSFANLEEDEQAGSIDVVCGGNPGSAEITARPTTVEIAPSYANVAHSLITVTVFDDDDDAAYPGDNVVFFTDRCAIETIAFVNVGDEDDEFGSRAAAFTAARSLFGALNPLLPSTAYAIEDSYFAAVAPDSNRQQDEIRTFDTAYGTVAPAILHCDPIHAPGVTPGVATITAVVDVNDDDDGDNDIVVKTTVTVVGPPAPNGVTVTASPATLICGEKATITVDVKDSIGQPVSDHTLVEAVTNAGGVLAGTGAVAGGQGLVTPLSSTLAETFGGKATFYLLTSTQHVGKYEVVVTTGGGGGVAGHLGNGTNYTNYLGGLFTTAPISVQVTVECSVPAPAPAPTTTGPTTGTGITPPSTGDAGLATSSSSAGLTLVAGAVAAVAALGLTVKKVIADKVN